MNSDFYDHLKMFSTNPYMFIGSGLSRRYLNLPTWLDLLKSFFSESELSNEFEYFQSKSNNNLPVLATTLSKEFHEIWWKSLSFEKQRKANKEQASESLDSPFKIEIAEHIKKLQNENKFYEKEMELFKTSVIDGIITTNWDEFSQTCFPEFKVFIGQQELLFSESISIGEIYKIHGCVTKPNSLILTQEDYADFNSKNAYLAAKLLTIFVEHPIIFIGYSLSDVNIQQIIDSIVQCVDTKNLDKLKDRLIFVEWEKGKDFEIKDSSMKLPGNKVLPIKLITTDSFLPVFETLSTLKRKIPVKILRKLKASVVEFVKSSNPTNKIFIKDIDSITDDTKIEYAIGVGVATNLLSTQGYKAIESIDIIEDILFENKDFDATLLIENTFTKMCKGNAYIPVYKYLKEANLLNKSGSLNPAGISALSGKFILKENTPNCFLPKPTKQAEIRRNHKDVNSVANTFDVAHALIHIPLLEIKTINLQQLVNFLRSCFKDKSVKQTTSFRKLVCLYDFLKNAIN